LPEVPEAYVHRIGRTARAGAEGQAVSLCDPEERPLLRAIEKLIKQQIPAETRGDIVVTADDIADRDARKARPRQQGRGGQQQGRPPRQGQNGQGGGRSNAQREAAHRQGGRPEGNRPERPQASAPAQAPRPPQGLGAGRTSSREGGRRGRRFA
jgi:ATP-dependent RNA helicase RhlE